MGRAAGRRRHRNLRVVELEFLYSARSLADRLEKQRLFQPLFTWVAMPDDAYERANEIQQRLTEAGHQRSAGAVVLLISVTAERHRLSVLTDDRADREPARRVAHQSPRLPPTGMSRLRCALGPED